MVPSPMAGAPRSDGGAKRPPVGPESMVRGEKSPATAAKSAISDSEMVRRRVVHSPPSGRSSKEIGSRSGASIARSTFPARALTYDDFDPKRRFLPDIASVLLITSVLVIIALGLLTVALIRMGGMTRRLQVALDDESGARDRAALLLAMASAVNSSLGLEEVLDVAIGHPGRIMCAVPTPLYLLLP